jgi:hypothetical protein
VIDERDLQDEKQDEPRISTFRGIMIDLSDDDENASDVITCKRISYSKKINEIDFHSEKKNDSKISKFPGIQIREQPKLYSEQENSPFTRPSHTIIRRKQWNEMKFLFFLPYSFSSFSKASNCLDK